MSEADLVIYGTLITLGILVLCLAIWGIRNARRAEIASRSITADWVRQWAGDNLQPGQAFVWGVWQKVLAAAQMDLHLHTDQDQPLMHIEFFTLPRSGVVERFSLAGITYDCVREGIITGRVLLRETQSQTVILSCEHKTLGARFFKGQENEALYSIKLPFLFKNYAKIMRGSQEISRLSYAD